MERKLYDAAREGSLSSLQKLLKEDPIILDRVSTLGNSETPLHIAAILGNCEFAKELLDKKPSLVFEVDSHKSTPLHLASATNNVELVRLLLLKVDSPESICRGRDEYGRYPVHVAAVRGRIHVLKALLKVDPAAAYDTAAAFDRADQNDTIFHLCIKFNQFEALKVLMEEITDPDVLNLRDSDGNTILHLSVLDKQSEVVSYLLRSNTIDVNAKNAKGQTAMDMLCMGVGGTIGRTLHNAGAVTSNYSPYNNLPSPPLVQNNNVERKPSFLKFLEDKQEAVMIAASLIAAAAFQAGVSPPGGIHDNTFFQNKTTEVLEEEKSVHRAGTSIMAYSDRPRYTAFIVQNTVGFVAALTVFLLLLTGLPHKYEFFNGCFMVSIWIAIVAIAASYFSSVIMVAPPTIQDRVIVISYVVLGITVLLWVAIILWYAGLGPRIVGNFQKKHDSKDELPRSGSLLAATGAARSV